MPTFLQYYLFHFFANCEETARDAAVQGLSVHLDHDATEQACIHPLVKHHLLSALLFERFPQFGFFALVERRCREHQSHGDVMCLIVAPLIGTTHARILKQEPSLGNELQKVQEIGSDFTAERLIEEL